jgi:hypothetical protein
MHTGAHGFIRRYAELGNSGSLAAELSILDRGVSIGVEFWL